MIVASAGLMSGWRDLCHRRQVAMAWLEMMSNTVSHPQLAEISFTLLLIHIACV